MKWLNRNRRNVILKNGVRPSVWLVICFCVYLFPASVFAQLNQQKPAALQDVGIEEHLGDQIPLDVVFETSDGDSVTIRELMDDGKPVLLNPVYYNCPMLCSMVTDAVYSGIRDLDWSPGMEFKIITFSIDPDEHRQLADSARQVYLGRLDRPGAEDGWHFLTGKEESIRELTQAVGFNYTKVEETGQFAHSAAIMFLSPEGTITRYLYGIDFDEFQVRNALYEAADGRIGNTIDKIVMYCYQYDPGSQSYVPVAFRIMQIGGLVTVLILGIFLGLLWLREKDSKNSRNPTITNGST